MVERVVLTLLLRYIRVKSKELRLEDEIMNGVLTVSYSSVDLQLSL